MGVPAAPPLHPPSQHLLVAQEAVLEGAGQDVVHSGQPVGGRRALVENERLGPLSLGQAALEDALLLPEAEDALL